MALWDNNTGSDSTDINADKWDTPPISEAEVLKLAEKARQLIYHVWWHAEMGDISIELWREVALDEIKNDNPNAFKMWNSFKVTGELLKWLDKTATELRDAMLGTLDEVWRKRYENLPEYKKKWLKESLAVGIKEGVIPADFIKSLLGDWGEK